MSIDRVDLTRGEYLKFRRKCRLDGRGPRPGFSIRYDIPGHESAFSIANFSNLPFTGTGRPYTIYYDYGDRITRMVVAAVRT